MTGPSAQTGFDAAREALQGLERERFVANARALSSLIRTGWVLGLDLADPAGRAAAESAVR